MSARPHIRRLLATTMLLAAVLTVSVDVAHAQELNPYVEAEDQTRGGVGNGAEVLGSEATNPDETGSLPLTGGEMATLAACGVALLLIGGAVVTGSRRRSADA